MAKKTLDPIEEYRGPYEHWMYGKGKKYAFPQIRQYDDGPVGVLVELADPIKPSQLGKVYARRKTKTIQMLAPTIWQDGGDFSTRFLPLVIPGKTSQNSARINGNVPSAKDQFTSRFRLNFPLNAKTINIGYSPTKIPKTTWKKDKETQKSINKGEPLTIIAVIDDGIAFAHKNLRKADGKSSRVEYCWLQSAAGDGDSVLYGKEFTRNDIDKLINTHADEDTLYRAASAADASPQYGQPLDLHTSHGATVLDIAAGNDPNKSETPLENVRIIAVQLPNTIAWDTSAFGKDNFMLAAFHYIFERADRIAGEYYGYQSGDNKSPKTTLPLVLNFSFGFTGGPHDAGSARRAGHVLEHAIDEMVIARRVKAPTAVVMPSGNNFSDQLHVAMDGREFDNRGDNASVNWRIQPNDRTSSYMEIWLPQNAKSGDYKLCLQRPNGEVSVHSAKTTTQIGQISSDPFTVDDLNISGETIGQVSIDKCRRHRWRFLIAIAPTEPEPQISANGTLTHLPATPAGKWKITITRVKGSPPSDPVMCWIQRDSDLAFHRSGSRQSYFDRPDYEQFDPSGVWKDEDEPGARIRRYGSLNGLATGTATTVISGYRGTARNQYKLDSGLPANYSAAGPVNASGEFTKNICASALTDQSTVISGIRAAGTRSGAHGRIFGTSGAAPQIARQLATVFATHKPSQINKHASNNYCKLLKGLDVATNAIDSTSYPKTRLGKLFVKNRHNPTP